MSRTFEVSPRTNPAGAVSEVSGYEVVFKENGTPCFSTFFASEWVSHKGATFDVGFEQACAMGHSFVGGGNG